MNELLTQLVSLQSIDLEIDKIDNAVAAEQKDLNERIAALTARKVLIGELQEKITRQEKESRTLEDEMADKLDYVKERQTRMIRVQTSREQAALLKEIEDGKRDVKDNEDRVVAIMESIEVLTVQLKENKNLLKGEKKLAAEETEEVQTNIAVINKERKKKENARSRQANKLKGSLLHKYDTLRQRRNGLAVINVVDGVCQGCYMSVPPQRFNMLLKGDQIFDCPTCQRLNYYVPPLEKETIKTKAKKKATPKTKVKKKIAPKTEAKKKTEPKTKAKVSAKTGAK